MSEIINRVARAIDDTFERQGRVFNNGEPEMLARAAIEAMRELPEEPGQRYTAGEYSRRTQEAMVDDALETNASSAE